MTDHIDAAAEFAGRVLIAALFLGGAVQKAVDPAQVQGLLVGLGMAAWLVWPALVFNAMVAIALILGVQIRAVAWAAAGYCMFTSIFHYLPDDPWQMTIFVKNWAIAGGCLVLGVHGPGAWALQPRRGPLG
ncbi:DoxX family protein [Octadecabacter sp.]|nr:DoxX family protein [Octadecabacter sp.]